MKARKGFLMKKLNAEEAKKKEVKAKKIREKVVIVKDIKPMLDDLEDIEHEMKEKEAQDKILKLQKLWLIELRFVLIFPHFDSIKACQFFDRTVKYCKPQDFS